MNNLSEIEFELLVKNAPLVSIDLIIFNSSGKVLLGKRKNEPAANFYFVPGGRINKGETLEEAFLRITKSELGIQIPFNKSSLIGVFTHIYNTNYFQKANISTHYVAIGYKIYIDESNTPNLKSQHHDAKWLTVRELMMDDSVHQNTKQYLIDNFTENSLIQYQVVSSRRQIFNNLLWQTPVLSLTAQAFLFNIILENKSTQSIVISSILSIIISLGSIQLLAKHRFNEKRDAIWLDDFEKKHSIHGFVRTNNKPFKHEYSGYINKISSYRVWQFLLLSFTISAIYKLVSIIL